MQSIESYTRDQMLVIIMQVKVDSGSGDSGHVGYTAWVFVSNNKILDE